MSEEFELINSKIPDLQSAIAQRLSKIPQPAPVTFDPYKAILKKKQEETAPIDPASIKQWPDEDTKKLEDYCAKMGIVGFNSDKLPPIVALRLLRQQIEGKEFEMIEHEKSNIKLSKQLLFG